MERVLTMYKREVMVVDVVGIVEETIKKGAQYKGWQQFNRRWAFTNNHFQTTISQLFIIVFQKGYGVLFCSLNHKSGFDLTCSRSSEIGIQANPSNLARFSTFFFFLSFHLFHLVILIILNQDGSTTPTNGQATRLTSFGRLCRQSSRNLCICLLCRFGLPTTHQFGPHTLPAQLFHRLEWYTCQWATGIVGNVE